MSYCVCSMAPKCKEEKRTNARIKNFNYSNLLRENHSDPNMKSDKLSLIPVITCGVSSNDSVIWGKFKLIWTSKGLKGLTRRSVSDKKNRSKNLLQLGCCKTIDFPILDRHKIGLENCQTKLQDTTDIYQCSRKTLILIKTEELPQNIWTGVAQVRFLFCEVSWGT